MTRCDNCGRFSSKRFDVWTIAACPSIDRSVCRFCAEKLGIGGDE